VHYNINLGTFYTIPNSMCPSFLKLLKSPTRMDRSEPGSAMSHCLGQH
jgi:hypothetical protein